MTNEFAVLAHIHRWLSHNFFSFFRGAHLLFCKGALLLFFLITRHYITSFFVFFRWLPCCFVVSFFILFFPLCILCLCPAANGADTLKQNDSTRHTRRNIKLLLFFFFFKKNEGAAANRKKRR